MAGVTRLELATSGVTGQRSNQLSYTPDWEGGKLGHAAHFVNGQKKRFGQQTPRRWGWRTPLKKRSVARIKKCSPNNVTEQWPNVNLGIMHINMRANNFSP